MTTWNNSLDGPNGTAVTASNSASYGTAFTLMNGPTGTATATYDTSQFMHGTASMNVTCGATSGYAYPSWTLPAEVLDAYFRFYLRMSALPPATTQILDVYSAAGRNGRLQLSTAGTLYFSDAAASNNTQCGPSLSISTWYRIEMHMYGDPAAGLVDCYTYAGDATTVVAGGQYNLTARNTRGTIGTGRYGFTSPVTSTGPFWFDDPGISDTGLLGPTGSTSVNTTLATAGATAAPPGTISGTQMLYPTGYNIISGTWANQGSVTGAPDGLCATWTDSGAGDSAVLELTYGSTLQAALPAGSTVTDVQVQVWHGETPSAQIASASAQAYPGGSAAGSAQALTVGDSLHGDLVTFTGVAYADLADFRIRVTVTRH